MTKIAHPQLVQFSLLRQEIYTFLESKMVGETIGLKESQLVHSFQQEHTNFSEEEVEHCIESLIHDGDVKLYYPQNSYVGYYRIAR